MLDIAKAEENKVNRKVVWKQLNSLTGAEPAETKELEPERQLICAMVRDAWNLIMNPPKKRGRGLSWTLHLDRRDAANWFTSMSQEPWSFRWCCYTLQQEPEPVQKLITAYLELNPILPASEPPSEKAQGIEE